VVVAHRKFVYVWFAGLPGFSTSAMRVEYDLVNACVVPINVTGH
jgi:hypothetical protein